MFFFFSSRRRHTRCALVMEFRRVLFRSMVDMGKPMIAALKGAVLGAGCEYALVADIRLAAPTTRLALPEVNYGLAVDQGGSALAASLIGPSRTKWMLMTGEPVDAETALAWGLVDFVVPLEELDTRVDALARKKIGRASCRGRVGKYVEISVGAV